MSDGQLESSPLWADIKDVIYSGSKQTVFSFKGMLHTEKEDLPMEKITEIETMRDFGRNIGEHSHIRFKMGLGDYFYRLYPYRDNLEFSIKAIPLGETGEEITGANSVVTRYKAVFKFQENPQAVGNDFSNQTAQTLNQQGLVDVGLQLEDRSLEPLRIKTVYGIFRSVSMKQLIFNLLMGESIKVLVDGKQSVDGIDIVDPDNTVLNEEMMIPQGTLISSLPTYLQERGKGVYRGGIGTFLQTFKQKKMWFVYPLYDLTRFNKGKERLVIYAVPEDRLPGIDRTYKNESGVLYIVATGKKVYHDTARVNEINEGFGFRMADANAMMKKPVLIEDGKVVGARAQLNFEVGSVARKDGMHYAPSLPASANPFKEYSKGLQRQCAQVDLVWENALPDLICPGMPCKYVFMDKGQYIEKYGTVLGMFALTKLQGKTLSGSEYRTTVHLSLMTEMHTLQPDLPIARPQGDF